MGVRVLLADDHPVFRQGLRALLEREKFDVVGEASDGLEAIAAAERLQPQVVVIDQFAKMTDDAGEGFTGLDRYKAREKVVEEFERLELLEKVVDYEFSISKCERCKTVIEPLISTQWFMRMDQLRDLALGLMNDKKNPSTDPR